jgi:hypothetical protein
MRGLVALRRGLPGRIALAVVLLVSLAAAAPADATESLAYRWSLHGFMGRLAGIVVPNEGRGELRSHPGEAGRVTELEITSQASAGEFFLYGGELRADGTTAEAWSSYRWRGREKSNRSPVEVAGVVDVASGIHLIRDRHPSEPLSLRIWSDGRVYPVRVEKVATEQLTVPAGRYVADHYRIRGVRSEGEKYWKGGLDLWLAHDEAATPVQIQVERGFANVRLELLPAGG